MVRRRGQGAADLHGVLVVDKPVGMSSAAVVDRVKKRLGVERAGHSGTLDPIATGVLPICLGEATKLATFLLAEDKAYEADLELGVATDTYDRTGHIVSTDRPGAAAITAAALAAALAARVGPQTQVPPQFSAIKQGGVRLYERARAGEVVAPPPREVVLYRLDLIHYTPPIARIAIACTKGTYVRSLIADLGRDLGVGAHMLGLRRTQSGAFTIAQAVPLDALSPLDRGNHLIRLVDVTDLPRLLTPPALIPLVLGGVAVTREALGDIPAGELFQLVDDEDRLLALAEPAGDLVRYRRVFREAPGGPPTGR
jgi:tRNA pseudouridine55 synthase